MKPHFRPKGLRWWRDRLSGAALLLSVICRADAAWGDFGQDAQDASSELFEELTDCLSYQQLAGECIRRSGFPDKAQQADRVAAYVIDLLYKSAKAGGVSDEAVKSQMRMSKKDMADSIDRNCANLIVLIERWGLSCKSIIEHPDQRLIEIVKSYSVGGHPQWPFQQRH